MQRVTDVQVVRNRHPGSSPPGHLGLGHLRNHGPTPSTSLAARRVTAVTAGEVFGQFQGHEQVVYGHDDATGLRAIVALHSTALGPALGGTRFFPYATDADALADVLHLSRAMSYKNALAGLGHGGGKAVIIGDPAITKTPALLRAYGRFIDTLAGRYITACDVGTYVADMDVIAESTRYVTGRSPDKGGSGDSSVLTALGVLQGMRACAAHLWGSPSLQGRRVTISGVGKVGHRLVAHLLDEGCTVIVHDVARHAVDHVLADHPGVQTVETAAELIATPADIYSPNALGSALDDATAQTLPVAVICGGANNQLAHPGIEQVLADRGVCYAPDYLVNAGGVIQVADELHGFDVERARTRAEKIFDTTLEVLSIADRDQIPPAQAADRLAELRMAAA